MNFEYGELMNKQKIGISPSSEEGMRDLYVMDLLFGLSWTAIAVCIVTFVAKI